MLNYIFSPTLGESLTVGSFTVITLGALVLGFIVSVFYMLANKREGYSRNFVITLVVMPAITAVIILLVANSLARALSLAGAFSLTRFRSAPGSARDIAYVFFTVALGLICGMGYLGYALLFALVISLVLYALSTWRFAQPRTKQLKITMPEQMNIEGVFDDILDTYTKTWTLNRIKTSDFGALFDLMYSIELRPDADVKKFLDALRCRNGNLNIALTLHGGEEKTAL